MIKSKLRNIFLQKRQALSAEEVQYKSQVLAEAFFQNFDISKIKNLHIFLSMPEKGEINTQFIIQRIWSEYPHIQLVTSGCDFKTNTLVNFIFNPETKIAKNRFGVPEPINSPQITDNQIDIVLAPLLCFDEKGYRVGYGKGFYDRFLANCRRNVIKIGLSFFAPVEEIKDVDKFDIKIDYCLENQLVWEF